MTSSQQKKMHIYSKIALTKLKAFSVRRGMATENIPFMYAKMQTEKSLRRKSGSCNSINLGQLASRAAFFVDI